MATTQQLNQSQPFVGLGTSQLTVLVDGEYTVRCTSTIPAGSQLQIVVNKNGSPQYTIGGGTAALGPSLAGEKTVLCSAGDTLSVVFSSSAAPDQLSNAITSTINIFQFQHYA